MKNTNIQNIYSKTSETLNEAAAAAARDLAEKCQRHDGIALSYPAGDGEADCHCLLWGEDRGSHRLLAALAVVIYDDETAECVAFTDPECRRCGYFSHLLGLAVKECPEKDLVFAVSGECADTLAALKCMDADFDHSEHSMELFLDDADEACADSCESTGIFPDLFPSGSDAEGTDIPVEDPENYGCYILTPVSGTCVCLHHVEIDEDRRGQGYGLKMIRRLFSSLRLAGIKKVILQVSGDNEAALALYKKTGFRITETLSYYLY